MNVAIYQNNRFSRRLDVNKHLTSPTFFAIEKLEFKCVRQLKYTECFMVISFILVLQEFKNNNCYLECRAGLHKKINPDRDKITNEFPIVAISDKFGGRNPSRVVIE